MPLSPRTLRPSSSFTPRSISGLALWLDASATGDLYTTDAGPVTAVSSPTEISGCVLWLDGADSSAASMTLNGSLVETWKDKSGNNRNATASGSARPTTGTRSLNGRSVVDFNGTSNFLATSLADTATQTVLFVAVSDAADSSGRVWCYGTSALRGPFSSAGTWAFWRQQTSGAIPLSATSTTPSVCSLVFGSNSSLTPYANGAMGTANDPYDSEGLTLDIGRGGSSYHDGYIAEIVVYNTALSTADRARVEAYLAAKWGISGVHAAATSASDPVGYWRDRSGNGRHATQATGASRPQRSTVNSRGSIQFDGTDDTLATFNIPTSNDITLFCAWRTGASIAGGGIAVDYANSGDSAQASSVTGFLNSAGVQVTSTGVLVHRTDSTRSGVSVPEGRSSDANAVSVNTTGISTIACSYGESTTRYGALNGASLSATTRFNGGIWSALTLSGRRASGTIAVGGPYWSGQLCEVLIYERNLAQPARRMIERYLAAKWGITLAPQVSNADAQDWINRVYANGGTVTSSTASAVNSLCVDLENAGLRDRFYRLNLFCGTGLNAALVPLYRGPSLGGTQYGNATDTNVGPFVSGDYVETGASGGLLGNGSSKYLNTGLAPSALPSVATGHMAAYVPQITPSDATKAFVGNASGSNQYNLSYRLNSATGLAQIRTVWGATASNDASEPSSVLRGGLRLATRTGSTALRTYHNSTQVSLHETSVTPASHVNNWFVFAFNSAGTPIQYSPDSMRAYSIGESMSAEQVAAYYTAMQAFQTALGRNV